MAREILVVRRDILFGNKSFQGFLEFGKNDYINIILNNYEYIDRDLAEGNPKLQQPIPYVWIVNPKTKMIFAYRRAADKNYRDQRLRNKWSCGVGGHIDRDTEENSKNPIIKAMMRELKEEVVMINYPTPKIIGYINDDSDSVGRDHFGIVAIAETNNDVRKGDDEMAHGRFYSLSELERIFNDSNNDIETWTRISWPFVKDYLNKI